MIKKDRFTKYFKLIVFFIFLVFSHKSSWKNYFRNIFQKSSLIEFISLFAFTLSLSLGFNFIAMSGKINLSLASSILIGQLFFTIFAIRISNPILVFLLAGALSIPVSFLVSYFSNYLDLKLSIDTVVSSLITNYIALYLVSFINFSLLRDKSSTAMASRIFMTKNTFPLGIILSLILFTLYIYIYKNTSYGENLLISGENRKMASLLGFKPRILDKKAVFLASLFAALSAGVFLLENYNNLEVRDPSIFWDATLISITSRQKPIQTLIFSFIFTLVKLSFSILSRRGNLSYELVVILETIFIFGLLIFRNRGEVKYE